MKTTTVKEGFLGQQMIALPKSVLNITKTNKITQVFYISDLGYYPKASNHYRYRKNGANQYIFIYCTKGKGEINLNNTKISISPNQFFIIPKNIRHEYKANETNPWSIYWFHFNGIIAPELYKSYTSQSKNLSTISFSKEKLELFKKIFNLFNSNNSKHTLEHANLLSLNFISSFIYHNNEKEIIAQHSDIVVENIKDFLLNNLDKNYTLNHIASKFNYSKSYLHTKFKNKTGYSIMVFFNLKKAQRACEYIMYTNLSIKEISYKLGFQDPLYFSRIFKNYMGKSPKKYKEGNQK